MKKTFFNYVVLIVNFLNLIFKTFIGLLTISHVLLYGMDQQYHFVYHPTNYDGAFWIYEGLKKSIKDFDTLVKKP